MNNTELKEIWKSIPNYPNYMVSNLGNVKTLNYRKTNKGRILKPKIVKGYYRIQLSKNGKTNYFYIHRLVAEAFIPNPDNKPHIDHIDTNRNNNNVNNLRWVTHKENQNNPLTILNFSKAHKDKKLTRATKEKLSKAHNKPILQLSKSGLIILRKWESVTRASKELNIDNSNIGRCCRGERKIVGNYRWMYLDDYVSRMEKLYELTLQKVG